MSALTRVEIIDKNGVRTHRNKRLNEQQGRNVKATPLPAPRPASEQNQYDADGFHVVTGLHIMTGTAVNTEGNDRHNAAVLRVERPNTFHPANAYEPVFGQQTAWSGADQFGYEEDGFAHGSGGSARHFNDRDREGYNRRGFHYNGLHRETGTPFNPDGYDKNGVTAEGLGFSGESRPHSVTVWERDIPTIVDVDEIRRVVGKVKGASLLSDDDFEFLTRTTNGHLANKGVDGLTDAWNEAVRDWARHIAKESYGRQVGGSR